MFLFKLKVSKTKRLLKKLKCRVQKTFNDIFTDGDIEVTRNSVGELHDILLMYVHMPHPDNVSERVGNRTD